MPSLLDILGYAGNLLDLPGSSVRDLLSGNNPLDQWATPFSSDNRASGRDVLRPFLGENEETGMSGWVSNPMEGVKDIAGFGLEMAADPLNFVSLSPLWRALKGRKAVRGANAAQELANRGRYGYVNPKVLNAVEDVAPEAVQQAGPKLLGYTPDREMVYHGTPHDWAGSATAEYPYGKFDLEQVGSGEGSTVQGPGGYFAQKRGVPEALSRLMGTDLNIYGLDVPPGFSEDMLQWGNMYRGADPMTAGQNVFESMTGMAPKYARSGDVQTLLDAGITGMEYPSVAGRGSREYAVWDQDLLDQMRVREINGERVPINPMFGPVKAEQRVIPQIADSPLTEVINPMSPQPLPGLAKPVMQGAAYQALARFNSYGGSL